jgi:hypothetical protein
MPGRSLIKPLTNVRILNANRIVVRAMAGVEAMQRRVRQMYDFEEVVANAPDPREVEWIFGYGSIVFRHGFNSGQCLAGCIPGWKRTFYQLSTGADASADLAGCHSTWFLDTMLSQASLQGANSPFPMHSGS